MADTEIAPQTILETEDLEEEYEEDPRLALMEQMLADQKRTNAELVRAVTAPARPGPLQQDRVAPGLEFNFEGLPDPAYDRTAYERELAKRVSGVVGQRIDQTGKGTGDGIDDGFKDEIKPIGMGGRRVGQRSRRRSQKRPGSRTETGHTSSPTRRVFARPTIPLARALSHRRLLGDSEGFLGIYKVDAR